MVVPPGTKKAQVPPQIDAPFNAVVGVLLMVNDVVAVAPAGLAFTAVTVVPGAHAPIPDFTAVSIGGVVKVGWLDEAGKYTVAPTVPA